MGPIAILSAAQGAALSAIPGRRSGTPAPHVLPGASRFSQPVGFGNGSPVLVACRMTARVTCGVIVRGRRARAVAVVRGFAR